MMSGATPEKGFLTTTTTIANNWSLREAAVPSRPASVQVAQIQLGHPSTLIRGLSAKL